MAKSTFRYKFSDEFMGPLVEFARIHKFDDPKVFKDNWETWSDQNKELILRETGSLKEKGYTGNAATKMYKSARYYFKNKSSEKKQPRKRRQYIGLERALLDNMDEHINTLGKSVKPAQAFNEFMDDTRNRALIKQEKARLRSYNMEDEDIIVKIKKTYKNRHFNIVKKTK